MKIVCMIRRSAPMHFFVNELAKTHEIACVIVENPPPKEKSLIKRIWKMGVRKTWTRIREKHFPNRFHAEINQKIFGSDWAALNKDLNLMEVDSVNSAGCADVLREIKPDLLLVHGTGIVQNHILKLARIRLNLHWGLSPYYRGTYCTSWALLNWDPQNIGVTIHELTAEIDGGKIVAQSRVEVEQCDITYSVNMKLTREGTRLYDKIVNRLKSGEKLRYVEQDLSRGYLTYLRQWDDSLDLRIKKIEKNGEVAKMLNRPSRPYKLPIVEI